MQYLGSRREAAAVNDGDEVEFLFDAGDRSREPGNLSIAATDIGLPETANTLGDWIREYLSTEYAEATKHKPWCDRALATDVPE